MPEPGQIDDPDLGIEGPTADQPDCEPDEYEPEPDPAEQDEED